MTNRMWTDRSLPPLPPVAACHPTNHRAKEVETAQTAASACAKQLTGRGAEAEESN